VVKRKIPSNDGKCTTESRSTSSS